MSLIEPQSDLLRQPQSQRSSSPPSASFPFPESESGPGMAAGSASLDLLKGNPFLLSAPLLALNPALYAAQLAQLQAAQLMLAKQGQENGAGADRKRTAEDENHQQGASKAKYPRFAAGPMERSELGTASQLESPLDLSGGRSPDQRPAAKAADMADMSAGQMAAFSAFLPPNIISFFNQLKSCSSAGAYGDFSGLFGLAAAKSGDNPSPPPPASPTGAGTPATARNNPWQSQWMNRAADGGQISDVFKCVWCRESYQTLEALTRHMKEAKHHHALPSGSSYLSPSGHSLGGAGGGGGGGSMVPPQVRMPAPPSTSPGGSTASTTPPKASPPARDILKEQLPIPRKLVRGQDIWIGRADQQTRDILKCMGCGASFRSLDLLTKHMQETQHYKKVISHDQLSSWKYQDSHHQGGAGGVGAGGPKNHVNSVLSCKVCDKGFGSLKELSDHMVRANHYVSDVKLGGRQNGHNSGSLGMGSSMMAAAAAASPGSKERKKALPVKKLLELERARQEVAGNFPPVSTREILESGKLLCERCEERVPIDIFIPHIQQCVGRPRFLKSNASPGATSPPGNSAVKNSQNNHLAGKGGSSSNSSGKEGDASFSIVGSLEQLVKGNFQGPATANSANNGISSHHNNTIRPPTVSHPGVQPLRIESQFSPEHKFSINSLFPSKVSPVPSSASGSTCSSRPASPASVRSRASGAVADEAEGRCRNGGRGSSPSQGKQEAAAAPGHLQEQPSPSQKSHKESSRSNSSSPGAAAPSDNDHDRPEQRRPPSLGDVTSPPPPTAASPAGSVSSTASGGARSSAALQPASRSPAGGGGNALAALQMFCEDQRKTSVPRQVGASGGNIREGGGGGNGNGASMSGSPISDPGAILAFSWACNQAVVGGNGDSAAAIKCPFCETPFISKGAYRHHLSKMHFTKENLGSGPSAAGGFLMPAATGGNGGGGGGAARTPSPDTKDAEETLQSKYQKYSQLAKQLSCYDGTN